MNLPNKLTLLRIILVPVFIIFFVLSLYTLSDLNVGLYQINICRLIATIIFIIASITDFFDGKIARKYNLITNFGKLMDPLADKILVISALVLLAHTGEIHYIWLLLAVIREISISAIRLICLEQNYVVSASKIGKYKTATQMLSIVMILLCIYKISALCNLFVYTMFNISNILVVISFVDYVEKNKECIIKGGM